MKIKIIAGAVVCALVICPDLENLHQGDIEIQGDHSKDKYEVGTGLSMIYGEQKKETMNSLCFLKPSEVTEFHTSFTLDT
jgi:hypothetical protein